MSTKFILWLFTGFYLTTSQLLADPLSFWPFYGNAEGASTVNATMTTDRFNNPEYAYSFNGTSDFIDYAHAPSHDLSGEMSIEAWIYLDSTASNTKHTIILKAESASNVEVPSTYSLGTAGITSYRFCVGGQEILFGEIIFNEWTHLAVTFNHELQRALCYVNGELILDRPALLNDIQISDYPLLIGSDAEHDNNWHGVIDDIRLFDRVISETEVDSLYSLPFGPHIQINPEYELFFGDVYAGYPDTLDFLISNSGLGLDSLTITEQIYTGSTFIMDLSPYSLLSGESRSLPVIFNPSIPGYFSDMFQVLSNDNLNPIYNLLLSGGAAYPPEISVSPDLIQDTLYTGGVGEYIITIDNSEGLGDLEWSIDVLNDLNADTIYFEKPSWSDWTLPENQDPISESVWITRANNQGIFNIATEESWNHPYSPEGTRWAKGNSLDVPLGDYGTWLYTVDHHPPMMLDTVMTLRLTDSRERYDIIFDIWQNNDDGAGFAYQRISAPGFSVDIPVREGVTASGTVTSIVILLDASESRASSFSSNFQIMSNDIDEPIKYLPFMIEIIESPDISVDSGTLDFTETFIGYPDTIVIEVFNKGYGPLTILDLELPAGPFSVVPTYANIAENSVGLFSVVFNPTTISTYSDEIVFISNDPDEGFFQIPIEASGLQAPEISTEPGAFEEQLVLGDTAQIEIAILNNGFSDLIYEMYPFTSLYDTMILNSSGNDYPLSNFSTDGRYHRHLYTDVDEDSLRVDVKSISFSISEESIEFTISCYEPLEYLWLLSLQIDSDRNTNTGSNNSTFWRNGSDYGVVITPGYGWLMVWQGDQFEIFQNMQHANWTYGDNSISVVIDSGLIPVSEGWDIVATSEIFMSGQYDFAPNLGEQPITIPMWADGIDYSIPSGNIGPGSQEYLTMNISSSSLDTGFYDAGLVIISNDPSTPEVAIPVHLDVTTSIHEKVETPDQFKLYQNYPNPFNPSTTILYDLPIHSEVSLIIYDILGRSVWSYKESDKPAGYYSLQWDGLNQSGKQVASGVYLISFSTPSYREVQKAVLIR